MPPTASRPLKRKSTSTKPSSSKSRPTKKPRSPSPAPSASASSSEGEASDAPALDPMALLRAHFESQFAPIEIAPVIPTEVINDGDDDEDDEMMGEYDSALEDGSGAEEEDEEDDGVEVVHFDGGVKTGREEVEVSKRERRAFLSGKLLNPNASAPAPTKSRKGGKTASTGDEGDDKADDALNVANDLALQRLLKESHLLDPLTATSTLEATGKNRLKALDIRLDTLGLKTAPGQKMSTALASGIKNKKAKVEMLRRKEARENGIILEKEKKQGMSKEEERRKRKREMAPGFAPAVGKFKNGVLVLTKKDVRGIEGRPQGVRKSGKAGGKGRKKR